MDRKNPNTKLLPSDKVCHYILFPVVSSTIGQSNDFYFHALNLSWNDKNLLKDSRCLEMFRGLHLQEEIKIANLLKSAETGWFRSSRKSDLAKIGKVAGYFIRCFACSIGQALDEKFYPEAYLPIVDKEFNDCVNGLKENKTIVPVVVKLEISSQSHFDALRFVCLNEELVSNLTNGDEVVATRRSKLLKIKDGLHDWAWRLLNLPTLEERVQLVSDGIPFELSARFENRSRQDRVHVESQGRLSSSRVKYPTTRYPTQIFEMN